MKRYISYLLILLLILMCGCSEGSKGGREYSETKLMMDTICTIKAGGDGTEEAISAAFARIEEISAAVDCFSDTSQVSAINRAGAGEKIYLGDDVFVIIRESLKICKASGGAFDITTAPLKDLWDISSGPHEPPDSAEIAETLKWVGYDKITLDEEERSITKKYDKVKIDLGGVAKGYAADCAIEVLKQSGVDYALADLGGNIVTFGKNPARADGKWVIGIQKPFATNGELAQTVSVEDSSVVTAGTYQRYFEWNGERYHHITDPKMGHPSNADIESATIVAKSALVADCLSTACVVLGETEGHRLAQEFGVELIVN